MDKEIKVHCFFEQSGTFKNAFKEKGFQSFDYDIEDNFRQTDFQCDIFKEISKFAYNETSIFDNIKENDLIIAFFPCTYFSTRCKLNSRGQGRNMVNWNNQRKIYNALELNDKRHKYFQSLLLLVSICDVKNISLIVENPLIDNYLLEYFPKIYEIVKINNRTKLGDDFIKPTMFMFFNCTPKFSLYSEINKKNTKTIETTNGYERSMITAEFAENFIKIFIL